LSCLAKLTIDQDLHLKNQNNLSKFQPIAVTNELRDLAIHTVANNEIDESLLNGIIDYIGKYNDSIILVDWKTGLSQKYASLDQLKFYSLYIFNNFSDINKLKLFLFFVEQDVYVYEEVTRDDYETIKNKYINIISNIKNDIEYKCNKKDDCLRCEYYENCKPFNIKVTKGI
jgi:CRISPR/Cas system-associated exonuclease Cas4 (RecB family)